MAQLNFQRLFLLELLVREVSYTRAKEMDQGFLHSLGATIIEFTSENFPLIDMSEDEFGTNKPFDSYKVKFSSGKSCVFAMRKGEGPVNDKAQITVSRGMPACGNSSYFKFGTAYLKMSPEFLSVLYDPVLGSSSSKCLKVCLDVVNVQMVPVGSISIFLRLTCFGTTIYTQFRVDSDNNKSFSFKGDQMMTMSQRNGGARMANIPSGAGPRFEMTGMQNSSQNAQLPELIGKMREELLSDLIKIMKANERAIYMPSSNYMPSGLDPRLSMTTYNWQETGLMPLKNSDRMFPSYPSYSGQNNSNNFQKQLVNVTPNVPLPYGKEFPFNNSFVVRDINNEQLNRTGDSMLVGGIEGCKYGNVSENILSKPLSGVKKMSPPTLTNLPPPGCCGPPNGFPESCSRQTSYRC